MSQLPESMTHGISTYRKLTWYRQLPKKIDEYSLKIFEVMSNSSHDLRQKLEKSDFFKNISSNEFGQNLTGQSGSLFGIGDEKILSCNTNQKEWTFNFDR